DRESRPTGRTDRHAGRVRVGSLLVRPASRRPRTGRQQGGGARPVRRPYAAASRRTAAAARLRPRPRHTRRLRTRTRRHTRRLVRRRENSMIKVIEPGPHATNRTLEWWDDPRLDDTARARAVAAALDLPAEIVEIVTDSDEEVDLASVW